MTRGSPDLEQAFVDAGLEGAAVLRTVKPARASALIEAEETVTGRP